MVRSISKQRKKDMFYARLNKFPSVRNYHQSRFCIALYGRSGNKRLNFVNFQATFLILLAYIGVRDIEKFAFFLPLG